MSEHAAEKDAPMCVAQTYWYDSGAQRAEWCKSAATMRLRALDGSVNPACDEHGRRMIEAGARLVPPEVPQS